LVQNIFDGFVVILRLKGSPSGDQFKKGDPSGPNIYFLVVATSAEHFGCPVVESAGDGEHVHADASSTMFAADAKIDEFEFLRFWVV
jgi:hypothetical protein